MLPALGAAAFHLSWPGWNPGSSMAPAGAPGRQQAMALIQGACLLGGRAGGLLASGFSRTGLTV